MVTQTEQSALETLARAVAAEPTDAHRWKIYADALSEKGTQPAFLTHALSGAHIPDPQYFGALGKYVQRGELQLLFNRFHYIDAAWIRPTSSDCEAILRELLRSPLSTFLTQLTICIWSGGPATPEQSGIAQGVLRLLADTKSGLFALRYLSLGHHAEPLPIEGSIPLLAKVKGRSPHLVTTGRELVSVARALQLKLIRCDQDIAIANLKVGDMIPERAAVGTWPEKTTLPGLVAVTSRKPVSGLFFLGAATASHSLSLTVVNSRVILCNTEVQKRAQAFTLLDGDTVEIGPGVVFRVEPVAAEVSGDRAPELKAGPRLR